jgi:hypothetical protein
MDTQINIQYNRPLYFLEQQSYRNKTKTQRGHLILGVHAPTEGRDELNEEFYEKLQKILDKVNKNYYIMLIGDMNARVGNNRVANIVGIVRSRTKATEFLT